MVVVAAAAGVGTYFYLDNVLSYEYEASLDDAWSSTQRAAAEIGLPRVSEKKDFQAGHYESHMADGRQVQIVCMKMGEKRTQIQVRVGDFKGEANRQAAQTIHEHISMGMGLKTPTLPPADDVADDEVRRSYHAGVAACYDAAMKACDTQGYKPELYERRAEERGTISAKSQIGAVFISIQKHEGKTRLTVQVRGGSSERNKSAAREFHRRIADSLQEKAQDE